MTVIRTKRVRIWSNENSSHSWPTYDEWSPAVRLTRYAYKDVRIKCVILHATKTVDVGCMDLHDFAIYQTSLDVGPGELIPVLSPGIQTRWYPVVLMSYTLQLWESICLVIHDTNWCRDRNIDTYWEMCLFCVSMITSYIILNQNINAFRHSMQYIIKAHVLQCYD